MKKRCPPKPQRLLLCVALACFTNQSPAQSNSPSPASLVRQLTARVLYQPPVTNGLCLTPPMGWSEWNLFYGYTNTAYQVDGIPQGYHQGSVVGMMEAMRTNGMQALGYNLILPDVAMVATRSNGLWVQNFDYFPNGIPWLADYAHARGFRFGVYASLGVWTPTNTCDPTGPGRCGSTGYEFSDAAQWASWGMDYLKYDYMTVSTNPAPLDFARMREALAACGRPVVYNVCYGTFHPDWPVLGNTWRTTRDINRSWASISNNLAVNARYYHYAGPGHFNDPDMLEVGNRNWPNNTVPVFTPEEHFSHFALWCMMAAPLIAGNDVRHMDDYTASILMAPELIAVDQDPAGIQGHCVARDNGVEIWLKPLGSFGSGRCAVALFNPGATAATATVHWTNVLLRPGPVSVRDLYLRRELGTFVSAFTTNVNPHGTVMLGLTGPAFGEPCFLSDLVATNLPGWPNAGSVRRDLNAAGRTMSLSLVPFLKGLGMTAPATLSFPITATPGFANPITADPDGQLTFPLALPPGRPARFVADIALDDTSPPGSARFEVLLDGVAAYQSAVVTNGTPLQTVNLDITDRATITLAVTSATGVASANWGDARVLTHLPQAVWLAAQPVGEGSIRLTWPATAADYALQQSSANDAAGWQFTTNSITVVAGQCQVSVAASAGGRLFRLIHP
jgi:alpha-galactosidase